jgi:hypothetical protein
MPLKGIWQRCPFNPRCLNAFQPFWIGGPALSRQAGAGTGALPGQLRSCPSLRWLQCAEADMMGIQHLAFSQMAIILRLVARAGLLFILIVTQGDKQ